MGRDSDSDKAPVARAPLGLTLSPGTTTLADSLSEGAEDSDLVGSLLVIGGAQADIGTHVLVAGTVDIGREPVGLQLRDARCSRRHARVSHQDDAYCLTDLSSTNGTTLNGHPAGTMEPLHDGDKIRMGQTTLKFTLVDATEASYLRRMEQLAGRDSLTGLIANHRFSSLLAEAFRNASTTRTPLTVLMMDMDGLKAINDAHGHRMGAQTIREVGELIGSLVEGIGEATRFGGDEFCVFLPGCDTDAGMVLAETIRAGVDAHDIVRETERVGVSISIGVASTAPAHTQWTQLQEAADRALYRAKEKGRNCVSR